MAIIYENKDRFISMQHRVHIGCYTHLHKEIEVLYVLDKNTTAYINSEKYVLEKGDLFISFPNQVHSYETTGPENVLLLIFSPNVFSTFSKTFLEKTPTSPVIRSADLPNGVVQTLDGLFINFLSENLPYKEEICRGLLMVFLGQILPKLDYIDSDSTNNDMLSRILSYCNENYTNNISLETAEKDLCVSKFYISRLFSEKLNIHFNRYIQMLRVNDAKDRLVKTDDPITQIANDVGFNTIRSFNRVFALHTGVQPREYRETRRITTLQR